MGFNLYFCLMQSALWFQKTGCFGGFIGNFLGGGQCEFVVRRIGFCLFSLISMKLVCYQKNI